MDIDINVQDLPGIGRRYEVMGAHGGRIIVVIHHSGRRDVYSYQEGEEEQPSSVVQLNDAQARKLGAILGGAYFKPAIVEEIEAVIGDLLIDWVTLAVDSPATGKTIGQMEIRRRTGMTVVAIVRAQQSTTAPEPTEQLVAGDRLVVVGRREDFPRFQQHVVG